MRRIYCELELNLRIKLRKRLLREVPDALTVTERPNEMWSMDFIADLLPASSARCSYAGADHLMAG